MYVCMYVCMCVCVGVCMYVCIIFTVTVGYFKKCVTFLLQ